MDNRPETISLESQTIIDWNDILQRADYNDSQAEFLLINFVSELFRVNKFFEQARSEEDIDQLAQSVQKLYNICQYCSVPRLQEAVEKFAADEKALSEVVMLDMLSQEMQSVLSYYKKHHGYA